MRQIAKLLQPSLIYHGGTANTFGKKSEKVVVSVLNNWFGGLYGSLYRCRVLKKYILECLGYLRKMGLLNLQLALKKFWKGLRYIHVCIIYTVTLCVYVCRRTQWGKCGKMLTTGYSNWRGYRSSGYFSVCLRLF